MVCVVAAVAAVAVAAVAVDADTISVCFQETRTKRE